MSLNFHIFENSISKLLSFGKSEFDQLLAQKGYPLTYDVSHAFIYLHGDNKALQRSLETLKETIIHYHLVDSLGKRHDSLTLGQGKIYWAESLPLFNEHATSILKDLNKPIEQLESHAYLTKIAQAING